MDPIESMEHGILFIYIENHKSQPNVDRYTSPMDSMGMFIGFQIPLDPGKFPTNDIHHHHVVSLVASFFCRQVWIWPWTSST